MEGIGTALRRTLMIVLVAAGIGAVLSWQRRQQAAPTATAPPQWPPWPAPPDTDASPTGASMAPVDERRWLPAHDDGSTPDSHPVKAKESSGIFHEPGGRFYDRTKADRCYPTAAAAEADGYRRSKT